MQFRDEVAQLMAEIGLRGWKTVTATRDDVKHFRSAVVILKKDNLLVDITRDKGYATVDVAGQCQPDVFCPIGWVLLGLRLTGDFEGALHMAGFLWPPSMTAVRDGLTALRKHEDVLQNAFSALRWADTDERIEHALWLVHEAKALFKRRPPE